MASATKTIRDQYPASAYDVAAGQLALALADQARAGEHQAAVGREYRGWEDRLRTVEGIISAARPGVDFVALAAALAERDVLKRALEDRLPAVLSANDTARNFEDEVSRLAHEYELSLSRVDDFEQGRSSYSTEAERARLRLVELAGEPKK